MIGDRGVIAAGIGLVLAATTGYFAVQDARGSAAGPQPRSGLTVIAPAAAGGGWDLAAREVQLAARQNSLVGNTQVVNVPGAGGSIGLTQLMQLDGDPTTVMISGAVMVGGVALGGGADQVSDTTPLARLADDYDVVAVPADSEWETLEDFTEAWVADPDMPIGGGSAGSVDHLIAGQLAREIGLDPGGLHYAPHSGGGDLSLSLLSQASGTVEVGISGYNDFRDLVDGGRLKVLAVVSPERLEGVDAPTMEELGYPEVNLVNWRGVLAAPGIDDEQRDELVEILQEVTETEEWAAAVERNRWQESWAGPDEFAAFIEEEEERTQALLEELGML